MKRKHTDHSQSGFTLLEMLIAVSILTLGLLSVIATTYHLIQSNRISKNMTIAVNLAQNKIDGLKTANYTGIENSSEIGISETGTSGGIFNRTVTVTENSAPDFKLVEVSITWSDTVSRTIPVKTIIAE